MAAFQSIVVEKPQSWPVIAITAQQIFISEHAGGRAEGMLGTAAAEGVHLSEVPVTLV